MCTKYVSCSLDAASRLTGFGTSATYTYNGNGLRMSKTVSGTTSAFTWDEAEGTPLALVAGATDYVYGPGGVPLSSRSPGVPQTAAIGAGASLLETAADRDIYNTTGDASGLKEDTLGATRSESQGRQPPLAG
jgi:hypothetical protein